MDNYELGKDIQQILSRLDKVEAALSATSKEQRLTEVGKTKDKLFDVKWTMARAETLRSGPFNPQSETRVYEEVPGGYKLTVSGENNGKPYSWGYTALYDGKDHPVWGRPDADSIEPYKVNDRITIGFFKKGGMPGGPYSRKLSEDGKSLQVQTVGRNPDGSVYYDVIEYKQP